ncbi:hypothetical protein [Vibrio nigripulchritudo]|uniref:hypothetical protein n=1 Tax=Vibrio nigripulchritudo TaxID=28173 RepID=UPI000697D016|nr:hypothetical protein [Vibrio nigripulchritudo]
MAKGRLQRRKITPKTKATVSPISPSGRFEVFLGKDGETIPCLDLMDLHDGDKIIRGLNLFLRGKRLASAKVGAGNVLNYLRFALNFSGVMNTASLDAYVDELSADSELKFNTKYQKYAAVKKFAIELQESGVLPDEMEIPEGFDSGKVEKTPTPSFAELARHHVEDEDNFNSVEVKKVAETLEIDVMEAQALIFSLECMDILHLEALSSIKQWESDWDFTQSIIDKLTPEDIDFYKNVDGIADPVFFRERTAEEAIAVLYAKFGLDIPAAKYWPQALDSFLRETLGWKRVGSRVKSLFKGNPVEPEDAVLLEFAKGLSEEQLEEYRELENFSLYNPRYDLRTVEAAIAILYVHHGRLPPDSTKWPPSVTDYLKHRDWVPNRVRASLFPTTKSVAPFIVGLLSYMALSPNVDTVAQYAYLQSFTPAEEEGKVRVYLDKYRGEPVDKPFDADDEIIAACVRHVERLKGVLHELGERGEAILRQEKPQLWLQYTALGSSITGDIVIRTPEVTTVTNTVRGFIKEKSEAHPILKEISKATGENFRPTNALIMKLSGETSAQIQKTLNHRFSQTTDIYTERVYTQTILKTKQKKFMRFMVDSATNSETKVENNKSKPENDLWDGTAEGVDEWINCEAQRFWFHDVDIVSEWIAWERNIADSAEELSYNNPKRWAVYWAPRLARYRSMLALVTEVDLKIAAEKANSIILPPLS